MQIICTALQEKKLCEHLITQVLHDGCKTNSVKALHAISNKNCLHGMVVAA